MQENLQLQKLPQNLFEDVSRIVEEKGPIRFLDPQRHLGFDIFDEHDQPIENTALWD